MARKAGASSASILLTGESGTGKELFAQLIHDSSPRKDKPFVRVNCAALSRQLIESELFGHEKGSFTDAVAQRRGRFECASGGSILLDEVSETPIDFQAKLLRVLESGEFERVGGSETMNHDVRVIAASNRNLAGEIRRGGFRLDLYHRLNVIEIGIPPLRERRDDIELLATHFLHRFRTENQSPPRGFSPESMRLLTDYDWPGNVRELRNVIHRACILASGEVIDASALCLPGEEGFLDTTLDLRVSIPAGLSDEDCPQIPNHWLRYPLSEIEKAVILAAIDRYGNHRVVAEKLGVCTRTLSNKIRRYRDSEHRDAA